MSDTNCRPLKGGALQGDDKDMPDRGTSMGVTDSYGADLGQSAKGRKGRISSATKSDPAEECFSRDTTI